MNRIKIKKFVPGFEFKEDCIRIQKVFAAHKLDISLDEAKELWEEYSDAVCASWLILPEDNIKLFEYLKPYYTVIENRCQDCGEEGYIIDSISKCENCGFEQNPFSDEKDEKSCKGCDGSGWQNGDNEGFICNYCDAACSCKDNPNTCLVHIDVKKSR
jgi:hypothetical protein